MDVWEETTFPSSFLLNWMKTAQWFAVKMFPGNPALMATSLVQHYTVTGQFPDQTTINS